MPQDILGENRHQGHIGGPHDADEAQVQKQKQDRLDAPDIGDALAQAAQAAADGTRPLVRLDLHQKQGPDHCYVAGRIEREADARAGDGQDEPSDGRTDQARPVKDAGVQGDGVAQVRFVLHHLDDKALPQRNVKAVDEPQEDRQGEQVPQLHGVSEYEHGEQCCLEHRRALGQDHQAMAAEAVGQQTGPRGDEQRRDLAGEVQGAQQPGVMGPTVHKPLQGHPLHPGADV